MRLRPLTPRSRRRRRRRLPCFRRRPIRRRRRSARWRRAATPPARCLGCWRAAWHPTRRSPRWWTSPGAACSPSCAWTAAARTRSSSCGRCGAWISACGYAVSVPLWAALPCELRLCENRGKFECWLVWMKALFLGDAPRWAYAQLRLLVHYRYS